VPLGLEDLENERGLIDFQIRTLNSELEINNN
jgi:hypothetical protein